MKILVTGATGLIGGAVAAALAREGVDVLGLARSPESAAAMTERGITAVRGDLLDAGSVESAARDVDGVVHAGSPGDHESERADRAAVGAVLRALDGTGKPLVYTSGLWLHGDTGDEPATEDDPLDPTPLVAWRVPVEWQVLAAADRDVRTVVIRPALVYGHGAGVPAMLVSSAIGGADAVVRFVGDGGNRWAAVHADDLADLYVRALHKAPAGTVLIAAEPEAPRVADVALAASVAAGIPGRTRSWPLEEARKQLGPFADALVLDQAANSERAHELLDWRPQAPGLLIDLERGSYTRASP